jgi:hypothetical protein
MLAYDKSFQILGSIYHHTYRNKKVFFSWCCLGFWHSVVSQVNVNVSEKHGVSIFGAEMTRLESGGLMERRQREGS